MALKVVGSSGFQANVLTYLRQICPCLEIQLLSGKVTVSGGACCCMHETGCSLIAGLVLQDSCDQDIKIRPVQLEDPMGPCGSIYVPKDLTVLLCPDQRLASCYGKEPGTPAVTLAHELGHALMNCSQGPNTEARAICIENQVRCELQQPPRCNSKDGKKVTFSCDGLASTWSPAGCSFLSRLKCALAKLRRMLWLLLHFRLGCVLKSIGGMVMSRVPEDSATEPDLAHRVRTAQRARDNDLTAGVIDRIIGRLPVGPGAPRVLMLDRIVVGLPYIVTLIEGYDDRVEVVTNWTSAGGPWPPTSPPLVRLVFEGQTLPPMRDGEERAPPSGVGGRPTVDDGVLESLTVGVAGALPAPARLYAVYADPPTDDEEHPDWQRWKAISDFNRLRRRYLYELTPDRVEAVR